MRFRFFLVAMNVMSLFSCKERSSQTSLSENNRVDSKTYYSVELTLADNINQIIEPYGMNAVPYYGIMSADVKCGDVTINWHSPIVEMSEKVRKISLSLLVNDIEFPHSPCNKSGASIELEKLTFSFTKSPPGKSFKPDPVVNRLLPLPHTTINLLIFVDPTNKNLFLSDFSDELKEFPVPMGSYLDEQGQAHPAVGLLTIQRVNSPQKN